MSLNISIEVKSNADESTDLVELLEELYLAGVRLGTTIESDYLGQKVVVNPRGGYAVMTVAEGGMRFFRRGQKGWVLGAGASQGAEGVK